MAVVEKEETMDASLAKLNATCEMLARQTCGKVVLARGGFWYCSLPCDQAQRHVTDAYGPPVEQEIDTRRCAVCGGLNPGDITHTRC